MSRDFDQIDRKILRELQNDGRISKTDLADRINLSQTATVERVKRLSKQGVIVGYKAILSPEKLGRSLMVFIEVKLERTTPEVFEAFATAALESDEIMECHMVAGGFDYLLKVRLPDMGAYRSFLNDTILALPGVRETHTYTVMEEVKNSRTLPV